MTRALLTGALLATALALQSTTGVKQTDIACPVAQPAQMYSAFRPATSRAAPLSEHSTGGPGA